MESFTLDPDDPDPPFLCSHVRMRFSPRTCWSGSAGNRYPRSKAQPKPAPSGRPFNAHFTDVAKEADLRAPVIYGGVDSKKYIVEANGCGCAFIDYDNDGWMDIFLLSGTRLGG